MKKILAAFLCALIVLSLAACGNNGGQDSVKNSASNTSTESNGEVAELEQKYAGLKEDELKWEYNSSSKTIVISGEGPMKDYGDVPPQWEKYCDEAEKIVFGDEVTSVGCGAFLWFSKITEISLGQKIEFIGISAFSNCEELRTVNFPAGLKYVGDAAFNNDLLHSSSGFKFPDGMLFIGSDAFRSAFKENTVTIPASLSVIKDGAFANTFVSAFIVDPDNPGYASVDGILYDKEITTLINYPADKHDTQYEIPGTVKTILKNAVEVTRDLKKIIIPATVSSVDEGAIFWNYGLSYIDVDVNNNWYKSVDGVLFSKDGKKLLCYPVASERTEYTVPEGTERICNYAMSQAKNLKEIHTNDGLTEIGDTSLYFCENLTKLGLPKSLTSIETKALNVCNSLTEINYAGKSSDWKNISVGENNEILTDGKVRINFLG